MNGTLPHGRHVVAELRGVPAAVLRDGQALSAALRAALTEAGADVRQVACEVFAPQGVTAVAVLAESHASVHTWPEHGMAFVDVFTCGDTADPERAVTLLGTALGAGELSRTVLERGAPVSTVRELIGPGLVREWAVSRVRWQGDTGFQRVLIAETAHGVTLFCDGERQSAELSQLTYHEAMFLPAVLLAERCADVLVIGSSEGVVSQLARGCGASRVDHVDIDRAGVRACAEHLPYGYTSAELAAAERGAGPVRVHYADGAGFVAEAAAGLRWDVIVVDLPDENGDPAAQHNRLYGEGFLRACAERLRPGGVLATQAGCPTLWRNGTLSAAWHRFTAVFGTVAYYGSDEHEWAFLFGRVDELADPVQRMISELATLPYRPATIDADALRGGTVPPYAVRATATAAGRRAAGNGRPASSGRARSLRG